MRKRPKTWVAAAVLLAVLTAGPGAGQPQEAPKLRLPIACEPGLDCEIQHYVDRDPGPGVFDFRCGIKTYDGHNGIDFRAPDMAAVRKGVNVLAAAPGRVARLRATSPDRAAGQPLDPDRSEACGNGVVIEHGGGWETQYCHMAQNSIRVRAGDTVVAGQPIGRVGMSGNTEFPHLHFLIRRDGATVDPFAPDMSKPTACQPQAPGLWLPGEAARMTYREGAVLNAGWTSKQPTMIDVENGDITPLWGSPPLLIVYVRAIALLPGDEVELVLRAPDGTVLARNRPAALSRWRAQDLVYVGKRMPPEGWPTGTYVAEYRVHRRGGVALSRRLETRF